MDSAQGLQALKTLGRCSSIPVRTLAGKEMDACLRPVRITPEDAGCMARWRYDAYKAFFVWILPDPDEMLIWLKGYQERADDIIFFIEAPCGVPIGQVSIYNMDPASGAADFGRLIRGEKKGPPDLIFCACRSLLGWVFDDLKLHRVALGVFADNHRAVRLYKRLGFRVSSVRVFKKETDPQGIDCWMKAKKMTRESASHLDAYRNVYQMTILREEFAP